MKITRKTTMEQLQRFLCDNAEAVKKSSKDLFNQLAYASKMLKKDASKVTRQDLVDLAKSVMTTLGESCVMTALAEEAPVVKTEEKTSKKSTEKAPAENSLKTAKGVAKSPSSDKPKAETTSEEVSEKKAVKKSAKKGEPVVQTTKDAVGNTQVTAFPETLVIGDDTYVKATGITSLETLHKALEKDDSIVFAFYWNKTQLKMFPYFEGLGKNPKSFENDLDLATVIYCSDSFSVSYAISMYTEACYSVVDYEMKPFEETGIKSANGIEFEIYILKNTTEDQSDEADEDEEEDEEQEEEKPVLRKKSSKKGK